MRRLRTLFVVIALCTVMAVGAVTASADERSFTGDGVSLTLSDSPDPVSSGGEVTYSYRVTNVSGRRIPDPPPPPFDSETNSNILLQLSTGGFYGGEITSMTPSRGSCTLEDPPMYGHCNLGILQPGETATVTIKVTASRAQSTCPRDCLYLHAHTSWWGEASGGVALQNPTKITPESGTGPVSCTRVKRGTAKNDHLVGTRANDKLIGRGGDDSLSGRRGDDCLSGGSGKDRLTGGAGRDSYSGGSGNDYISAADGVAETIRCGKGRDAVLADRTDSLTGCERVRRF